MVSLATVKVVIHAGVLSIPYYKSQTLQIMEKYTIISFIALNWFTPYR